MTQAQAKQKHSIYLTVGPFYFDVLWMGQKHTSECPVIIIT